MRTRPKIAVSACLLGEKVRYDGEDKRSDWVASLATDFDLIGLCPEVAIGLGIPRPTIGLFLIDGAIRIRQHIDPDIDVTEALVQFGWLQAKTNFSGCVLKARSPSCGIADAALLDEQGELIGMGQGGFVRGLLSVRPNIPLINEEQLRDESMRQVFIKSVRDYDVQQGTTP